MSSEMSGGQLVLAMTGEDKASFENFWKAQNFELVDALIDLAGNAEPGVTYFYGASGSGKSHLLYAMMRAAKEQGRTTSYLSLDDQYVSPQMLEVLDVSGLVCLDNIQAWAGDVENERALFTLFEQIKHAGGQLVVAAKQAPDSSDFSIRDLVSRLSSGLIYPLHELGDAERFEALKMRANHRGLVINDDALKFLVSRVRRDASELFGLLDKIDKASLVEQRKITIPFLQSILDI